MSMNLHCKGRKKRGQGWHRWKDIDLIQTPTHITYACYYANIDGTPSSVDTIKEKYLLWASTLPDFASDPEKERESIRSLLGDDEFDPELEYLINSSERYSIADSERQKLEEWDQLRFYIL